MKSLSWMRTPGLEKLLTAALVVLGMASCAGPAVKSVAQESPELLFATDQHNTEAVQAAPYVVLVSIDGYRHDYNKKFEPENLQKIAAQGVQADALLPIYPSKTFPNHYSIVTGLYANHHGIVSNEFLDPVRNAVYSIPNRQAVEDGSWYGGDPLWNTIEKQGGVTATFFWVGADADIEGRRPNHYYRYDESVPNAKRVAKVIEWLKLPPATRPHFIALYFSDVDTAGHRFGPDAPETREAVASIDSSIGQLKKGLDELKLPMNLIIVSDHGMDKLDMTKTLNLDQGAELTGMLSKFRALGRGPQMLLYLNKGENPKIVRETKTALEKLAKKHGGAFRVRRGDELKSLNYDGNPRVGDLVIEPEPPWSVGLSSQPPYSSGGNHGWDPKKSKAMGGIFYAVGPAFKAKSRLPAFENIHVYPLVLEILGMKPTSPIDGKLAVTRPALK